MLIRGLIALKYLGVIFTCSPNLVPEGFLDWNEKKDRPLLRDWNLWTIFCLRINYYENVKFHIPLQRSCSAGFLSWQKTTLRLLWKELQVKFVFNQLRGFELCIMRFKFTWIFRAIWFRFLRLIRKLFSPCFFFLELTIHLESSGIDRSNACTSWPKRFSLPPLPYHHPSDMILLWWILPRPRFSFYTKTIRLLTIIRSRFLSRDSWQGESRVEVSKNEKCCGKTNRAQASVSTAFSSSPKLSRDFLQFDRKAENIFCILRKHRDEKKKNNLLTLNIKM